MLLAEKNRIFFLKRNIFDQKIRETAKISLFSFESRISTSFYEPLFYTFEKKIVKSYVTIPW